MSEHRPTLFIRFCLHSFLALFCGLLLPSTSPAQFLPDVSMFTRSFGGRDVLEVQATLKSPPSPMAGVAKLSIVAPKPSPADRNFEVVLYVMDYRGTPTESIAYRREVRLAQGDSRIDLQITFVQPRELALWDVDLFEDGRNIEDRPSSNAPNPRINSISSDKNYSASLGLLSAGESQEPR